MFRTIIFSVVAMSALVGCAKNPVYQHFTAHPEQGEYCRTAFSKCQTTVSFVNEVKVKNGIKPSDSTLKSLQDWFATGSCKIVKELPENGVIAATCDGWPTPLLLFPDLEACRDPVAWAERNKSIKDK